MIGTKIRTSPQPSNSCRFVCNNLKLLSIARAHTRWYPVCVPMTLKQAEVHGQGGLLIICTVWCKKSRRVVAAVTACYSSVRQKS